MAKSILTPLNEPPASAKTKKTETEGKMANNNSKQFLRIEGNAVHVVTERIERTVKLEDLMSEAQKDIGLSTPILPHGCRFYHQKGNAAVFVVEQTPTTRAINWFDQKWRLSLPYVVFHIVFIGDSVSWGLPFYRKAPLTSPNDILYKTNFCNIHNDYHGMCTGNMRVSGETTAQKAESYIQEFWSSEFNSDITYWFDKAKQFKEVSSLERWQSESEKNPLFPLQVKWFEHGKLADQLRRF
jgi:hypothetical protein